MREAGGGEAASCQREWEAIDEGWRRDRQGSGSRKAAVSGPVHAKRMPCPSPDIHTLPLSCAPTAPNAYVRPLCGIVVTILRHRYRSTRLCWKPNTLGLSQTFAPHAARLHAARFHAAGIRTVGAGNSRRVRPTVTENLASIAYRSRTVGYRKSNNITLNTSAAHILRSLSP